MVTEHTPKQHEVKINLIKGALARVKKKVKRLSLAERLAQYAREQYLYDDRIEDLIS